MRLICRFIVYNTAPTPSHDQTLNLPPPPSPSIPIVYAESASDRRKLASPDRRRGRDASRREDRAGNASSRQKHNIPIYSGCIVFAVIGGGSLRPRKWTSAERVKYDYCSHSANTNLHTLDRVHITPDIIRTRARERGRFADRILSSRIVRLYSNNDFFFLTHLPIIYV